MEKNIESARSKLREAIYFGQRMLDIEDRPEENEYQYTREEEFSFVLSACLNACYSALEILRKEALFKDIVQELRNKRRDIYKNGELGGWRTISVHYKPVVAGFEGYIPPPANNIIFIMTKKKKYTQPSGDQVNFDFGQNNKFYFTQDGPQNSIAALCYEHFSEIQKVTDECEKIFEENNA